MPTAQLRSHIPIGGPARREPADGTESDMRVSLGFEPTWFHERCGVDFSERWHRDPHYRHASLRKMKQALCQAFPTVPYWKLHDEDDLATLSGCYGIGVIPALFGLPLQYFPDRWPTLAAGPKPSIEELEKLTAEKLLSTNFVEELFRQMDVIESEWGKIHGYLNWQGVLNNAFHLRGEDIFLDMHDRPDFAHFLFSLLCNVMIQLAKMIQGRQRESGFYVNHFVVSNCTVNMISPRAYREFVFPYDQRIAEGFERFGLHTCNWNATPYFSEFVKLPKLGYLDMGIMSDMTKAKALFPEARRAVLYSPVKLQESALSEIGEDLERIHRELSPCDVILADTQATTPDDRVNAVLERCRRIESR